MQSVNSGATLVGTTTSKQLQLAEVAGNKPSTVHVFKFVFGSVKNFIIA